MHPTALLLPWSKSRAGRLCPSKKTTQRPNMLLARCFSRSILFSIKKKKGLLSKITDGSLWPSAGRTASNRSCLKTGRCHHRSCGCSFCKTSAPPCPPRCPERVMEPFFIPHLHGDILVTLAGLSDSNPGDEVVALEEVQAGGMGLLAGRGRPMPNRCRMRTHLCRVAS